MPWTSARTSVPTPTSRAGHARHVFAFEPNPGLARRLRTCFPSRVTVIEAALSDHVGNARFHVPVQDGRQCHELGSLEVPDEPRAAIDVAVKRLDDYECGDVGFLKIDVERHDREVLRGAARTIERYRPNLILEVTPLLYDQPLIDVLEPLFRHGYHGYSRFEAQYLSFEHFDPHVHANAELYRQGRFMGPNVVFTREPMSL
jgi:FkbM family methyltransferase